MLGAGEILLMNQLMTSNHSSYSDSTSSKATKLQLHKTEDMFLQLNEVQMNGTVKEITINFGYVKSFRESKYRPMKFEEGVWKDSGEIMNVTQVTLMDGETINVHESVDNINFNLNR